MAFRIIVWVTWRLKTTDGPLQSRQCQNQLWAQLLFPTPKIPAASIISISCRSLAQMPLVNDEKYFQYRSLVFTFLTGLCAIAVLRLHRIEIIIYIKLRSFNMFLLLFYTEEMVVWFFFKGDFSLKCHKNLQKKESVAPKVSIIKTHILLCFWTVWYMWVYYKWCSKVFFFCNHLNT